MICIVGAQAVFGDLFYILMSMLIEGWCELLRALQRKIALCIHEEVGVVICVPFLWLFLVLLLSF